MLRLHDDGLGGLDLGCEPFVVVSFEIGSRQVRPVVRNRALADGTFDETKYTGARVITAVLRLNEDDPACSGPNGVTMQSLFDQVLPYMSPRRRPTLSWSLLGSASDVRATTVRGVDAPMLIEQRRHPVLALQFVSPSGVIVSQGSDVPTCVRIDPTEDVEEGRTYDLEYNREYPPSPGIGDRQVTNRGTAPAHWRGTLQGEVEDPFLRVNGIDVVFEGLTLPLGSYLTIDTENRTMYLNDDPTESRYGLSNFTQWSWDDLLLSPGTSLLRFGGAELGVGARAEVCFAPTWE